MSETYGVTAGIPATSVTVSSGNTVAVSAAFNTTAGLVGGYDADNGSASAEEVVQCNSAADAVAAFGDGSELAEQVSLALQNGAGTVYAAAVSESDNTETISGAATGTLAENVIDPRVNTEHSITITDTTEAADVEVTYTRGSPTQPSEANTAELNVATGEIAFDESSDYDVEYTAATFTNAVDEVMKRVPRSFGVCTENVSVINDALATANEYDVDFDFTHVYGGEFVEYDNIGSYTNAYDDRRLAAISAARGFTDVAETAEVRTVGAVAGAQSGSELGDSTTGESLSGIVSLAQSPSNQTAATLIDEGVYPLQDRGEITVVKDTTTSSDARFNRVAWSEITDEVAEISNQISQSFVGEGNTADNRLQLAEGHRSAYEEMEDSGLLDDSVVSVSEGGTPSEVDVTIGVDIVDYMDTIAVDIVVGDVIRNGGAN